MTLKNTNANTTATTDAAVEVPAVETTTTTELVEQVKEKAALKAAKASTKRDWISIIGSGTIAGIYSAANMVAENLLADHLEVDRSYNAMEIIGVSAATAVVGSGMRAALDFVPQINRDEAVGLIATATTANLAFVASTLVRDSALGMLRGSIAVDVEGMAEEA